jgi:hypothetical protein
MFETNDTNVSCESFEENQDIVMLYMFYKHVASVLAECCISN